MDEDDSQVYKDDGNALLIAYQSGYYDGKKAALAGREGNFCERCGKRTWVGLTGNEWFEWWRVSKVADATEAEIDFADFLIIAHAVITKLKEKNNG